MPGPVRENKAKPGIDRRAFVLIAVMDRTDVSARGAQAAAQNRRRGGQRKHPAAHFAEALHAAQQAEDDAWMARFGASARQSAGRVPRRSGS